MFEASGDRGVSAITFIFIWNGKSHCGKDWERDLPCNLGGVARENISKFHKQRRNGQRLEVALRWSEIFQTALVPWMETHLHGVPQEWWVCLLQL